jgi:NodT family efflux transporter outer membrane factor (OMF) lipoprotein
MKKKSIHIALMMIFSGCSVGPVYEPPVTEVPCEWHSEMPETLSTDPAESLTWWRGLNDEVLNELMATAAEQSLDLHIAALRVLQARAEANGKKGDLYPRVDASANYGHVRYSKDALVTGLLASEIPIESNRHNRHRNFNFYEVGFDAEWEIDLFGMKAHEIAALTAREEAVQENLCAVWVTLSAEIAKNYIELRGLQQRLKVIHKTIQVQENTVKLTQELLARGIVDDVDANKSQSDLSELKAQQPLIELGIARAIHRIAILLGCAPGNLYDCLQAEALLPQLPCEKPIGMPSELLRRRPDIRKAERELASATERIGSAIASLFPRFSLRGFVGDISSNAGTLFNPSSATWFAGPQLLLPIFNSRLILQEVEYNKLVTQEALYNYQKIVLEALEESENAIASYRYGEERLHHLEEAHALHQKTFSFAGQLYANGVYDYLTVASTEKALLASEDTMVQSQVDLLLHYVSLYKALGGSWDY